MRNTEFIKTMLYSIIILYNIDLLVAVYKSQQSQLFIPPNKWNIVLHVSHIP